MFAAAVVWLQSGALPVSWSIITTCYWVVFVAGLFLAWRFHSSRAATSIVILLLAHRALEFFSHIPNGSLASAQIARSALASLVPLNFALLAWSREKGFAIPSIAPWLPALFAESIFVAVLCRPGATGAPWILSYRLLPATWFHWTNIPQAGWMALAIASSILLVRILKYGKSIDAGLLWSMTAAFMGFQRVGNGKIVSAYFAAGGLILAGSLIENSYVLAYCDELTSLPARRAFNDAVLRLQNRYSIAVVDIDHFKHFNDTYGHETGDQVLRMVAARLARVSGGGQAFRVGGEEFTILFAGESLTDAQPHLEILRMEIEVSTFRVRGAKDRRTVPHGPDRRKATRSKKSFSKRKPNLAPGELSVTVSIGVAESTGHTRRVAQVIQAADKALYRAKRAGRNRVEVATTDSIRKRSIA